MLTQLSLPLKLGGITEISLAHSNALLAASALAQNDFGYGRLNKSSECT
jgi:hypothetical protein